MACVQLPAIAGSKVPVDVFVIPVPAHVPPAGLPPVKTKGAALIHTDEFTGQLTVGNAFTVTV